MKYVYGPVPSRRLGFSLGIDLVPFKTCSLNCIYCQLGRTPQKSVERKIYTQKDNICEKVQEALRKTQRIDYVTFSGSGEPTLNSEIGAVIREVKKITALPVAVLTNGTLLFREDVQKDLLEADVVCPSLDAASDVMFQKINRPHDRLKLDSIIQGLKKFGMIYKGKIWLEVMLIKDFNDSTEELSKIRDAISGIQPDRVYLNTVVRPPAEIYAKPLSSDEMMTVKNYFDNRCEVIAEFHGQHIGEAQNVEDAIIEMTKRRPLVIIDIAKVLGVSETNAKTWVNALKDSGKLKERQYKGEKYYSYAIEK
jgi:wyosine [tRNA(Phe)-imidazoG37] synthetase (radical SAM superfamily)